MIYLITGLPGNGKTLYAIDFVKRLSEKDSRPVFYARIKGLKLPWTKIDAFDWPSCPANSIVVLDECQQSNDPEDAKAPSLFGVRQRGAPVPAWAAALEVHRHKGLDLVLITQDPMLLDAHDRKLVGIHFHVKRNFGLARATVHEFGGVRTNVATSTNNSIRHEWSYPKDIYEVYDSAEVHTVKSRVPMRVWVFLALPFILAAIAWSVVHRLDPHKNSPAPVSASTGSPVGGAWAARGQGEVTPAEYVASFHPRVEGLAYTAPAYDGITKPVEAPYPAACAAMGARCSCYTQQGTALATTEPICRSVVAGGFFVPWQKPRERPPQAVALARVIESPSASSSGVDAAGLTVRPPLATPATAETSPPLSRPRPRTVAGL